MDLPEAPAPVEFDLAAERARLQHDIARIKAMQPPPKPKKKKTNRFLKKKRPMLNEW